MSGLLTAATISGIDWMAIIPFANRRPRPANGGEKRGDYMSIRDLRIKYGLTQQGLSDYTGIPKRTIENWEEGKRSCPEYMENLLKFFLEKTKKPIDISPNE